MDSVPAPNSVPALPVEEGSSSHSSLPSSPPALPSSLPSSPPPPLPPLPAPAEDGYLGDCSSDGGNEKNFPLPPDWAAPRQSLPPSPTFQAPHSPPGQEDVEPPAGLHFSALGTLHGEGLGYQVLPQARDSSHQSHLRTKLRSTGLRSRYNRNVPDDWGRMKASIAERKMRVAANTNNTELLERILASNQTNVRSMDEHKRTALHFAAAKGYSEVVELLLRNGADPNQRDQLGNTALHLAACTNHVPVVTLLLRAGTDLTQLDNNGRTPLQLAQAKLKILQRKQGGEGGEEMVRVRAEVGAVLEMMREYLARVGDTGQQYSHLLSSFSQRLVLHSSPSSLTSDLGSLLDSLSGLQITQT